MLPARLDIYSSGNPTPSAMKKKKALLRRQSPSVSVVTALPDNNSGGVSEIVLMVLTVEVHRTAKTKTGAVVVELT